MNPPPVLPEDSVIQTPRLVLRPPRLDDFEEFFEVARTTPLGPSVPPVDRAAAWGKFTRNAGIWALLGHGFFVVRDRADGSYLGDTGLARFGRGIAAMDAAPEAGWVMHEKARDRGIAFEAAQAAHDWFARRFGAQRTVCMIDPANAPSLALAGRLGYRPFDEGVHEGAPVILLERPA